MFYVICENELIFKGNLNDCIKYLHSLKIVKKDTYYWIVNNLEYDHPSNTEKRFNSYMTRYNNEYYDFIKDCQNNHSSLLKYMDGLKIKNKKNQLTISDFI